MRSYKLIAFLLMIILCCTFHGRAQDVAGSSERTVQVVGDTSYAITANNVKLDYIVGNVIFTQGETLIYCDSAIQNKKTQILEALGNVKIVDGDSITITSGRLLYEGESRTARLRNNVIFTKLNQATLYTDYLDYFRLTQEARYYEGGRLVDSTNVLTSVKGYYKANTGMASFKTDVVGVNPDYTLESDTLQYNTRTNIIYFRDQTTLTDKDGSVFVYDQGEYNTRLQKSDLALGEVETLSYLIEGKRMVTDDVRRVYEASGEVEMTSKEQNVIINGDDGFYDKTNGIAKVYGNALMRKILQTDTLYMRADTLVAIENIDPTKERILAYPNVKIWKVDLQGRADSLAYVNIDSVIHFFDDPVLWTSSNQMTADTITVEIRNNTIDKMNMLRNSFVVSEDTLGNFNQIKGQIMIAQFKNNEIRKVDVDGNAESHFFALDETETLVVGMNKSISSRMRINFRLNQPDNVSFYVSPDAHLIPPHELDKSEIFLSGFSWREEERPGLDEVLVGREDLKPATFVPVLQIPEGNGTNPEHPPRKEVKIDNAPGESNPRHP